MGWETRTFGLLHTQHQVEGFLDMYIQKKGRMEVGVKVRRPTSKKYGWKIQEFECKVLLEVVDGVQRWHKHHLPLKHKFHTQQPLPQQLTLLNHNLCKQLQLLNKYQAVQEWCKQPISEIFYVQKDKKKKQGTQKAHIQITQLSNNKIRHYWSQCVEDKPMEVLVAQVAKWDGNMSYPQLLDSLLP